MYAIGTLFGPSLVKIEGFKVDKVGCTNNCVQSLWALAEEEEEEEEKNQNKNNVFSAAKRKSQLDIESLS